MTISRMQQPRQMYGLGSFVKKAVKGVTGAAKSAVKGITGAVKDNPLLAAAALNFAPMLAGGKPFFGLGLTEGRIGLPSFLSAGVDKFKAMGDLGKAATVFAGGSLLGGVLGQAEETGDPEGITRNVGALRTKLADAYRNQRTFADSEDEEAAIAKQVERDVSEYTAGPGYTNVQESGSFASGGRVGFQQGGNFDFNQFLQDRTREALQVEGIGQAIRPVVESNVRAQAAKDLSQAERGGGIESFLREKLGSGIIPGMSAMKSPMTGTSNFGRELVLDALTKSYMNQYRPSSSGAGPSFLTPKQIGNFVPMKGGQFGDPTGFDQYATYGFVIDGKRYKSEQEAIDDLGIERYNMFMADGGRVGLEFGGMPEAVEKIEEEPKEFMIDKLKITVEPGQSEMMGIMNAMMNDVEGVMPEDRKQEFYRLYLPQLRQSGEISETQYEGLMNELFGEEMQNGGIMNLKGKEMDLRGGGFVPIGAKERADDVPARLSKNEFVFTADAVRAAGGGSVQKGAEKMYNTMKMLEGKIA